MSQFKLFVDRFAVYGNGKFVYDQKFHSGINIIRGANGTGKSTIMDLLNYGLGSESADWTEEQRKCDWVITQVSVNDHPVTLKRIITETGQERILFFDGKMDVALTAIEGWQKYPMRRSVDTHSFSQQIFELLNMPRHKTDDDKNLTMHQILRLIYVDQLSSTTKLLKEEPKFDNVTTRRAIGEYLLGIDALEAFNLRQELIQANKEFEKVNSELNTIYRMFGHDENLINEESLDRGIDEINEKIKQLEYSRDETRISSMDEVSAEISDKIKQLVLTVDRTVEKITELENKRRALFIEVNDTALFLKSLEERKSALSESQVAYLALGQLSFSYCPSCLEPLDTHQDGSCSLCNKSSKINGRGFAYSQLLNELNFQIKESKKIIEEFQVEISEIDSSLPKEKQLLLAAKTQLNEIGKSSNDKEAKLLNIASEIGFFRSRILSLEEKRIHVGNISSLQNKKAKAIENIAKLDARLGEISVLQENRYLKVYSSIELKAKELLKLDGGYEAAFTDPDEVTFDFAKDKMYVNGRSKFSASSMVVMKNSIRFSIFAHAADDKHARFPNLLLMDNIEDKGMQKERSQNFQKQMVEVSKNIASSFQLIFTTSMIADELEGTDLCVGPFYEKGMHTLHF